MRKDLVMEWLEQYLPAQVNQGSFLTAYTLPRLLEELPRGRIVLPICSLGESVERLRSLAPLVLPPLYHEALAGDLKGLLRERVLACFPFVEGSQARDRFQDAVEIVELPPTSFPPPKQRPAVVAFSVDTAVEEHGPHLPLMTDTLQSYAVLKALAEEQADLFLAPPVEYGHLTWGLPFGCSIDLTPPLLTRYVTGFADAIQRWLSPQTLYVVDVHGSIVHRNAIQAGLEASQVSKWRFRWLHEPLVEFAGERGDQHAGGVETALIEKISPQLIDGLQFPEQLDQIAAGQLSMERAIELSGDVREFVRAAEKHPHWNGIVGDIRNYHQVDADAMFNRMLDVAREDLAAL